MAKERAGPRTGKRLTDAKKRELLRKRSYEDLARSARRDPAAMAEILERVRPLLIRFAYSRGVDDPADAEDIVQKTLIRILNNVDRFDPSRAQFTTWASTILIRLLSNDRRDRRRRHARTSEYGDQIIAEMQLRATENANRPDRQAEARLLEERVAEAVARLPDVYREVMELEMREYTDPEIAEQCGLREGTVKSRKFRARQRLKELLADVET